MDAHRATAPKLPIPPGPTSLVEAGPQGGIACRSSPLGPAAWFHRGPPHELARVRPANMDGHGGFRVPRRIHSCGSAQTRRVQPREFTARAARSRRFKSHQPTGLIRTKPHRFSPTPQTPTDSADAKGPSAARVRLETRRGRRVRPPGSAEQHLPRRPTCRRGCTSCSAHYSRPPLDSIGRVGDRRRSTFGPAPYAHRERALHLLGASWFPGPCMSFRGWSRCFRPHQEKSESASTSLEALGNRKVAWSPRALLKVVGTASVIDGPHQALAVRVCHGKRCEAHRSGRRHNRFFFVALVSTQERTNQMKPNKQCGSFTSTTCS